MKLSFRQGIVQYQLPTFLSKQGNFVDIIVGDTPLIYTIAEGAANYLFREQNSVKRAWGPLALNVDQWLYWDIDQFSARRSFGVTKRQPLTQANAPASPQLDQHWFDTTTNKMKVWTGSMWAERLRVFACKLAGGVVPVSMSINATSSESPFAGTQVGLTGDAFAGDVLVDRNTGLPYRTSDGLFLTTETQLSSRGTTTTIKSAAVLTEAIVATAMAAHTIVKFVDFDRIAYADQFTASVQQFGIIETPAVVGQSVNVITSGAITNEAWNWPTVNAYLYSTSTGTLTTVAPIPNATPVATVISRNTILLGSPRVSITGNAGGGGAEPASTGSLGIVRLSFPATDPVNPVVVSTNDPRVVNALSTTGGTMSGPLVLRGAPSQPLEAASKQYVDSVASGLSFPLRGPSGSATAPPYSFVSSPGTGMSLSAGNTIQLSSSGAAVASFNTGVSYALRSDFVRVSNGQFSKDSDAAALRTVLRASTTNSTPTRMFLNGTDANLVMPNNSTWRFTIQIVARRVDSPGEHASITVQGTIARDTTASTTVLVGSPLKTIEARANDAWDVAVAADPSTGSLGVTVQGQNGKNIRWVADCSIVQVLF